MLAGYIVNQSLIRPANSILVHVDVGDGALMHLFMPQQSSLLCTFLINILVIFVVYILFEVDLSVISRFYQET